MTKQLVLMFTLSTLVGFVLQSQNMTILHATGELNLTTLLYVFVYGGTLTLLSIAIAFIPRFLYWVTKKKRVPEFITLAWSIWILLLILSTADQIYRNSIQLEKHQNSSNTIGESTAEDVYKKVVNSIYTIYSEDKDNKVIASGGAVAVTPDYLATNCHIIAESDHFVIITNHEQNKGELYSQHGDLCIVSVPGIHFKPVEMRPSKNVDIGEDVFAIGNPEIFDKSISNGIISNKHDLHGITLLQTNAAVSPGSSGGGLFDNNAKLIGITYASSANNSDQNINFALPTEMIEAAILEPVIDTSSNDTSKLDANDNITPPNRNVATTNDSFNIVGIYGKDQIALVEWENSCYILIPGRYNPTTITSTAIWIPSNPKGLIILSRVKNVENIFKFIKWVNEDTNIKFVDSKSYLFYNNKLTPLAIFSIDGVNQPAYAYVQDKPLTKDLLEQDSFLGQFYDYSQNGYGGLTSIEFGLNGFTDALEGYNQNCNGNN